MFHVFEVCKEFRGFFFFKFHMMYSVSLYKGFRIVFFFKFHMMCSMSSMDLECVLKFSLDVFRVIEVYKGFRVGVQSFI